MDRVGVHLGCDQQMKVDREAVDGEYLPHSRRLHLVVAVAEEEASKDDLASSSSCLHCLN